MKKNSFGVAFIVVAGGWWLAARSGDIVTDLGLTTPQVQETVLANVTSNQLSVAYSYKVRQLSKKIPAESRAAAVKALGGVVRSYTESNDFRTRYQEWLKNKYNISDEQTRGAATTQATTLTDVKSMYSEQAAMVQSTYSQMPPATLAMMIQSQIQMLQQELSEAEGADKTVKAKELTELKRIQGLSKTNPEAFKKQYLATFDQMIQRQMTQGLHKAEDELNQSKQNASDYQKRLADYKAESNVNLVLQKRLRDFIALAGSVDFDAKLMQNGSKMEFVNPDYRNRSSNWKLLYRMGKEPTLAAREFAESWLKALETKK